jgi:O-antigen ligase
MTSSLSNVSAEAQLARERRRASERELTKRQQAARDTARTTFSRFIILALCLALVLSTLAFGTVHSWSLAVFQASAGVVVALWAADAWRTRRLRVSKNFLQLPLFAFFALGLLQLLPLGPAPTDPAASLAVAPLRTLSLDPYATRLVLVQIGALFVFFAAALTFIDSPRRLRLVTRAVIIFGFALAIFGLIQFFVSPDRIFGLRETKQALGFGPFINRHHFANYMVMAAGLPLGLLFAGAVERDRRLLYAFSAVLMGIALVMTNSRGAMLALAAEVFFLVVVSGLVRRPAVSAGADGDEEGVGRPRTRSLLLRAAAGLALVLALLAGVVFFGGDDSLNRLLGTVNSDDPTTGRLHFWRGTLAIIGDYPWLGAGIGAFSAVYPQYDTSNGSIYRLEQAHNDYLQILADGGVVGFALGLLFVGGLFLMALRRMQSASVFRRGVALGALAGCFAALVHSFFDFPLHTTANGLLFLTLAALATVNGRVEQTRRRRRKPQARQGTGPAATPGLPERAEAGGMGGEGDGDGGGVVRAPEGEGAATA